jgi:adenine-specific DNA-methyltransferase
MAKKASKAGKKAGTPSEPLRVETLTHEDAKRRNIPTAEFQAVMKGSAQKPARVTYERNRDLDPQLMWRGKDEQDWSELVVNAPPLYIQEKVQPKVLIDNLVREMNDKGAQESVDAQLDLFADFNGIPEGVDKTDFYQHDQNWSNRIILGDSLHVMASLAEREGLRGKVQCIYFDPPYGIKFNSNFQWSTTSRDVKDGKAVHITREPEQVKAFRDTWRDGIHSYLTYLRDRLAVARDLLGEAGSVFVQISDENVHRVRLLLDEVFGEDNFCSQIIFRKTSAVSSPNAKVNVVGTVADVILWYAKRIESVKYRQLYVSKGLESDNAGVYTRVQLADGQRRRMTSAEAVSNAELPDGARIYRVDNATSSGFSEKLSKDISFCGHEFTCGPTKHWKTHPEGMKTLLRADRLVPAGKSFGYVRFIDDFAVYPHVNVWMDTGTGSFTDEKLYVVQTGSKTIERCLLMSTDPGDLVLDPTCGSGTTATVAEQWGRRWITIDTSRVALALARSRIMGARYPFYLLADSREGQQKEAELTRTTPSTKRVYGNVRHGFVYERVPHITLKSIANNAEIDVIWDKWQEKLEPLRQKLNAAVQEKWEEWTIPRDADPKWPDAAKKLLAEWWQARIARQQEIDKSIAAKAEFEYLYDRPYEDRKVVRVAGPFTVESVSPHRALVVDEADGLIDPLKTKPAGTEGTQTFSQIILANLKVAGVQQAHKQDKIAFLSLVPWPGDRVCADGRYLEGENERRAAIFIGEEFGTVMRADLVEAAREAAEAGFDALISCAFSYEARTTDFSKLGSLPVLKARMNADLHMATDLKTTGKGNLFVIFGEPDIEIKEAPGRRLAVKIKGVDVFDPSTGDIRSDGADGIACWFIDTDYNGESFFVRHAYFLGANDPYKALKSSLKAEIDPDAWATLNSDTSRPFRKPRSGRIAVKVINHLGDEVMKVFKVT